MSSLMLTQFLFCAACTEKYDHQQPIPMSATFTAKIFNRNNVHADDPFASAIGECVAKVLATRVQLCCHVAASLEMAFPPTEAVSS